LIEPDDGEIWYAGKSVRDMTDDELQSYRRQVGFVFQHFNLVARLTALQNTALGLVMAGVDRETALGAAQQALIKVGIGPAMHNRLPDALSGGQRQRVGIARALVGQPKLMLWDEPTASLDPILVQEVLEVMEELAVTTGAGMLVVTHELSFAMRVADRMILMDKGKIVEEGTPGEVFAAPASEIGLRYQKLWQSRYVESGSQMLGAPTQARWRVKSGGAYACLQSRTKNSSSQLEAGKICQTQKIAIGS
jgi:polar amino acid transport system ATP-binding protein